MKLIEVAQPGADAFLLMLKKLAAAKRLVYPDSNGKNYNVLDANFFNGRTENDHIALTVFLGKDGLGSELGNRYILTDKVHTYRLEKEGDIYVIRQHYPNVFEDNNKPPFVIVLAKLIRAHFTEGAVPVRLYDFEADDLGITGLKVSGYHWKETSGTGNLTVNYVTKDQDIQNITYPGSTLGNGLLLKKGDGEWRLEWDQRAWQAWQKSQ